MTTNIFANVKTKTAKLCGMPSVFQGRYFKKCCAIGDRQERGFTLVELLVVISIIALLLSILMPSLSLVREQAKRIVCMSNLRSLGLAAVMYAEDNQNKLPEIRDSRDEIGFVKSTYFIKNHSKYMFWGRLYELGHMNNIACFYCPTQTAPSFSYREIKDENPDDLTVMRSSYKFRSVSWDSSGDVEEIFSLTDRGNIAVAADLFHDKWIPGMYPSYLSHKKGYNVLHLGGNANFVSNDLLPFGVSYGPTSMNICWDIFSENQ